jgi:hypothetical protein
VQTGFFDEKNHPRWVSESEPDPDGALCRPEEEKIRKNREKFLLHSEKNDTILAGKNCSSGGVCL